ncbi:hypothetical protein [Gallaecimonas pentaromativorans]|uniref:Tse2 ADP-ribosyltransferase toxin domain-containing protein n=1 Tax=Gallaecimonas pentaromativorans TaxID=584787 RepID=A0A3N1PTD4_9GAMM|nr:hypothetical protein [Gallaecimonas pentaromativorans]ROQ30371.1 hypothetical protein EDC28_10157 [Gallaecimonas pentaromativorans]
MKEHLIEQGTIKSFFAKMEILERIFDNDQDLTLCLWRASRTDHPAENPLHPDFERRDLGRGQFREADVTIREINGISYIVPKVYKKSVDSIWKVEGTSLFDRSKTFKGKRWEYIEIPAETPIPEGLLIIKDDYNERFGATHYSIVPNRMMTVDLFKKLLKDLLTNVVSMNEKRKHG